MMIAVLEQAFGHSPSELYKIAPTFAEFLLTEQSKVSLMKFGGEGI